MTYDLDPKDGVRLIEGIEERARAEGRHHVARSGGIRTRAARLDR